MKRLWLLFFLTAVFLLCSGLALAQDAAVSIATTQSTFGTYFGSIPFDIINNGDTPLTVDTAAAVEILRDGAWQPLVPSTEAAAPPQGVRTVPARDLLHSRADLWVYGAEMEAGEYRIVQTIGGETYTAPCTLVPYEAYSAYTDTAQPAYRFAKHEAASFSGAAWTGYQPLIWLDMDAFDAETLAVLGEVEKPRDDKPRAAVVLQKGDQNALCIVRREADGLWVVEARSTRLLRPGHVSGVYNPYLHHVMEDGVSFCYDITERGSWDEGGAVRWNGSQWAVTEYFRYDDGLFFSCQRRDDGNFSLHYYGDDDRYDTFRYTASSDAFDFSMETFDRDAAMAAARAIYDTRNGPLWFVPGAGDTLPQPQEIAFPRSSTYDVYTGPGTQYARAGDGNAQVSTNDWIQVFGREGDWIMIQYNLSDYANRVGYIKASALPRGVHVPDLAFARQSAPSLSGYITDDPLRNRWELAYLPSVQYDLFLLATVDRWCYVEFTPAEGEPLRGFISMDAQ